MVVVLLPCAGGAVTQEHATQRNACAGSHGRRGHALRVVLKLMVIVHQVILVNVVSIE